MPLEVLHNPAVESGAGGAVRPLLTHPEEQISFTADNTKIVLGNDKDEGQGTLFVTTKHLIWLNAASTLAYRMDWPYILLHAVCRDPSAFPQPCLYAQLDVEDEEEEAYAGATRQQEPSDDDDKEEEEAQEEAASSGSGIISEVRFVPDNPAILESLWNAMNACAALNPDSDQSEGEGDFLFNASEMHAGDMDGEEDAADYGEGGEGVEAYATSNEQRMAALQMSMGASAEEMYGEDDDEEEEEEENAPSASSRRKSKHPDDSSVVATQIASASAQVASAAGAGAPGKKRERGEEPQEQSTEPAKY